jgi:hypothetical protein
MASILLPGGLAPAIGILGGGELGGDGDRIGERGAELTGGKGNNRGFEEKATGLKGVEGWVNTTTTTVTGGGVLKPGVGNSPKFLGLDQATMSGEIGVTRVSPSNARPGEGNSAGTLPKFRKWETSVKGLLGN